MNTSYSKVALLILVFCFSLVACAGKVGNANTASNVASNGASGEYPQEVKDAFLSSCVGAGSDAMFCACVLDKVQKKYSLEEFTAIESKLKAGSPPQEFVEFTGKARAECMKNK